MINRANLLGRVGKIAVKPIKNGGEITTISLATTKKYNDSSGTRQEQTTWHMINCFSKLSEIASKYVSVGDLIYVEGEIQNKKVETGEKAGQYVYSLVASDIKFIPTHNKKSVAVTVVAPTTTTAAAASPTTRYNDIKNEDYEMNLPF